MPSPPSKANQTGPNPPPTHKLGAELRDLALHYGMRALPASACSGLGAWLGTALGQRAHPAADARALELLTRLRPELTATPDVAAASLRLLWQNVGRAYAEFATIERAVPQGRTVLSDSTVLDAAYADDRPLILCFVHLGNWEVLGQHVASHPLISRARPFSAVIKPPANRAHAFIAARRRARLPVELVPMGRYVWHNVATTLRRPGGIVWLAADEVANGRVFAPHFGRRVRTDGNLGKVVRLAAATGASVLPMYNERIGPARFKSHILPVMEMPTGRLGDDRIREEVMRIDSVFDPIVRRHLTQWYMAVEFGHDPDDPVRG